MKLTSGKIIYRIRRCHFKLFGDVSINVVTTENNVSEFLNFFFKKCFKICRDGQENRRENSIWNF